jgi:hypothetical protein
VAGDDEGAVAREHERLRRVAATAVAELSELGPSGRPALAPFLAHFDARLRRDPMANRQTQRES